MPYRFEPPVIREAHEAAGPLVWRLRMKQGVTLIVNGDTIRQSRWSDSDALAEADRFYVGGHIYTVSDDEAAFLRGHGYDNLTEIPEVP